MIYCKIRWDNTNQLSILPSDNVGKESFSEFRTKIYEGGSIDRCLEYRDRITDTITVSINNTLDGSGNVSTGLYYLYACFKNHKLDTIGLCQDGKTPVDYDYYQKINAAIACSGNNLFYVFDAYNIQDNQPTGGWYYVADNSFFDSDWDDFGSNVTKFRRENNKVYFRGIVEYQVGNLPTTGLLTIINLPVGFRASITNRLLSFAADAAIATVIGSNVSGNFGDSHGTINSSSFISLDNIIYHI